MKSNKEICEQFKRQKADTTRGLSSQWMNSDACDAFYAGDSMDYRGDLVVGSGKKVQVQFNKVQPYINSVGGFMEQNIRQAKYTARVEDNQKAQIYTKNANLISEYSRGNANADDVDGQCSLNMLIKGYGATETALTYDIGYSTRDPNGELVMGDVTDTVGWDPRARARNLLDARWVYYRKSYSLEDAKTLFQDSDDLDFEAYSDDDDTGYRFDPTIGPKYDRSKMEFDTYDWDNFNEKTVWVYFYQWVEIEDFYKAENPLVNISDPYIQQLAMTKMQLIADESEQADDMFKFNPEDKELIFNSRIKAKLTEEFDNLIKTFKYQRKVFYTSVISGKKVFKAYRNISQQGFTVKFQTGLWINHKKIWVGMVNAMMEPVKYFNKSLTELMYIIAATAKGGYFVEEDAVDDIADFERKANKTDSVVMVAAGALSGGKIQPKKQAVTPSGYDQIIGLADKGISDSTGIDPTFLGSTENKMQTAQLQRQVVKQVSSTITWAFKSAFLYAKEWKRMGMDLYRVWAENNTGAVIRIAGEEGANEFLRVSKDLFAAEYDVDIIEAPQTPEEKIEMAQLIQGVGDRVLPVDPQKAAQCYAIGFKYLPLEAQDKQKLSQIFAPQGESQEVMALKQQLEQLTSEFTKVQLQGQMARTELDMAKVDKTRAEIEKTIQQAQQVGIENKLIPFTELSKVSVSV